MSRQYLKQLKQRAQRLLDQSSDEQEEEQDDINAYTATHQGTRSPRRIILDEPMPDSQQQQVSQFYEHESTDIELLKRCIALTNQNNNLKFLVEKLSAQVDSLKTDLKASIENQATLKKKVEGRDISTERKEELLKFQQAMQLIEQEKMEIEHERSTLRLKEEQFKKQQASLKQQWQQYQQQLKKDQRDDSRQSRQIQAHNDYTIRTNKREDYDKIKHRCQELQRRVSRLEEGIRQQRGKASRLCKFINKQVPTLNAIIVQLTAKLDAKFERQILTGLEL